MLYNSFKHQTQFMNATSTSSNKLKTFCIIILNNLYCSNREYIGEKSVFYASKSTYFCAHLRSSTVSDCKQNTNKCRLWINGNALYNNLTFEPVCTEHKTYSKFLFKRIDKITISNLETYKLKCESKGSWLIIMHLMKQYITK